MLHPHEAILKSEVGELYLSIAIRTIAMSLIGIFVPVYIAEISSITTAIIFFIIFSASHMATVPFAVAISSRHGPKHLILYSSLILVLFYAMLQSEIIWLSAVIGGIGNAMFWIGYHVDFSRNSISGKEIALMNAIVMGLSVIGPLIGGILIQLYGYETVFLISGFILVASTFPLFLTPDSHEPFEFKPTIRFPSNSLSFIAHGSELALTMVLWPLLIFSLSQSSTILGTITTVSLLLSSAFLLAIPEKKHENLFSIYTIINSLLWIGKALIASLIPLAFADGFQRVAKSAVFVGFDKKTYDIAKRNGIANTIMIREILTQVSRILVFLFFIATKSFGMSFLASFPLTLLYIF